MNEIDLTKLTKKELVRAVELLVSCYQEADLYSTESLCHFYGGVSYIVDNLGTLS